MRSAERVDCFDGVTDRPRSLLAVCRMFALIRPQGAGLGRVDTPDDSSSTTVHESDLRL